MLKWIQDFRAPNAFPFSHTQIRTAFLIRKAEKLSLRILSSKAVGQE
jgi:hypothetical protein